MTSYDDGLELADTQLDLSGIPEGEEATGDTFDAPNAAPSGADVSAALCAQLDQVLEALWSLADERTTFTRDSLTTAQLAMRICSLYPRCAQPIERVALGTGTLELYPREVQLDRERVRMTRRESALLQYLLSHRERIISRHELMERVWGKRLTGAAARTVDIHIHRLRSKLGPEFAERVETIRHLGYRFSSNPMARDASQTKTTQLGMSAH